MLGVKKGVDEVILKIVQMLILTKAKLYQIAFLGKNL